ASLLLTFIAIAYGEDVDQPRLRPRRASRTEAGVVDVVGRGSITVPNGKFAAVASLSQLSAVWNVYQKTFKVTVFAG
ncbi:hypothetical protein PFISCL1PPCAC_18150, partial [Pristionchus fissidentatus]